MKSIMRILLVVIFLGSCIVCDAAKPKKDIYDSENQRAIIYRESGDSKFNSGDKVGALEDYNKALDADPNFLYALYNRSILKRDLGDLEGSIEDMNRAISIYAKNYMMYYQLGLTLSELDRDEEAIAAFTKALKIESKHTQSLFNRAVCYNAVGNLKAALKDYDAIIKLNPYHFSSFLNRGVIHMREGRMRSAIDDFRVCERAVHAVCETNIPVLTDYNIGRVYYNVDENVDAITYFDMVIEQAPEFARAYYMRGRAKKDNKDMEGACEDFRKALELGDEDAKEYLVNCQ